MEAYLAEIEGSAEAAQVLVVGSRIGIAHGADADWGDLRGATLRDVAAAVEVWLNDPDAWEARR
ncbi:MAG: hypothetical protein ACP5VP_11870 [Candidatus Limnocylindrales bacterium]